MTSGQGSASVSEPAHSAPSGFIPPSWLTGEWADGTPRRLRYADAEASHEIVVTLTPAGSGFTLDVTERPQGSADPRDVVTVREAFAGTWEVRLALLDLEARLVSTGRAYARADAAAGRAQSLPWVPQTSRPHEPWPLPRQGFAVDVRCNHYHRRDGLSLLVLTIERPGTSLARFVLATLECYFQDTERFVRDGRALGDLGRVEVVHDHLAPGLLAHQWVKAHAHATGRGLKRLVNGSDFASALGPDWRATWLAVARGALERALAGETTPVAEPETPAPAHAPVIQADEITAALRDPRAVEIVREHLSADAEDLLVGRGEMAVRRYFAHVRRGTAQGDLYALRIVEGVLLTKWGLRSRRADLVLEEGRTVVRMLRELAEGADPHADALPVSGG